MQRGLQWLHVTVFGHYGSGRSGREARLEVGAERFCSASVMARHMIAGLSTLVQRDGSSESPDLRRSSSVTIGYPLQVPVLRRCLDHMIVFNERSLYRHLQGFLVYYHRNRTHLALEKDSPEPRPIQPPESGRIVSIPVLGGLHHRYGRRAA